MNLSTSLGVNLVLTQKYKSRFTHHLAVNEVILNAGQGVELFREQFDGQSGDATLAITNLGVLIVYDDDQIWRIKHSDITTLAINRVWTIVPRVRQIKIVSRSSPDTPILFHGGKTFAREVSVLLPIERLLSSPTVIEEIAPFDPANWILSGLSGTSYDFDYSTNYLTSYMVQRDNGSTKWLDFVPIMSTQMDNCDESGNRITEELKLIATQDFDTEMRELFFATKIPEIHGRWNPYTTKEISSLISDKDKTHSRILLNWYNLKHDLLEASFRAAWHLIKLSQFDNANSVLTLGAILCDGSDRLVLAKLNE